MFAYRDTVRRVFEVVGIYQAPTMNDKMALLAQFPETVVLQQNVN
jgi:hypothetical protein